MAFSSHGSAWMMWMGDVVSFGKSVCSRLPFVPSGFLVSLDDFYLLGSGLMMTQTTNNVFNSSLFSAITTKSLLAWQRVRLAHSLAHSGEEWAKIFAMFNSGEWSTLWCTAGAGTNERCSGQPAVQISLLSVFCFSKQSTSSIVLVVQFVWSLLVVCLKISFLF